MTTPISYQKSYVVVESLTLDKTCFLPVRSIDANYFTSRYKTSGTNFHTLHFIPDNVTLQFRNYFWLCWKQCKINVNILLLRSFRKYFSFKSLNFLRTPPLDFLKPYLGSVGRDILWNHKQDNSIPSLDDPLWLATVCWLTIGNTTCLLVVQLTAVQIPSET